jgi:hypothetical protein
VKSRSRWVGHVGGTGDRMRKKILFAKLLGNRHFEERGHEMITLK